MAAIPQPMHSVAATVYRWWQERGESEPERLYLGASIIGGPCERALWYAFRWSEMRQFDGRLYRLFQRGRNEEATIIEELRGIGVEVSDTAPDGGQWGFVEFGGHFRGHIDGAVRNTPYAEKTWAVLEAKTHSLKSFKELAEKGVKDAKPEHWHQMNIYMGQLGMDRAMYYAVCKDDDRIHTEWLHFDQDQYDRMMGRAERIVFASEPLPRISEDAAWYQCKFCDYHAQCHGTAAPRATCRTCAHVTPERDGTWSCALQQRTLAGDEQRIGCQSHRFIPVLLERFAEYQDTPDGINPQYRNKLTGTVFHNADDAAVGYSSIEIRACEDKRALGNAGVQDFKAVFGARIAA